jgi:hypothetical protein
MVSSRDAEGWIQKIISVRLNLVKEEMKFEMGCYWVLKKRSIV